MDPETLSFGGDETQSYLHDRLVRHQATKTTLIAPGAHVGLQSAYTSVNNLLLMM